MPYPRLALALAAMLGLAAPALADPPPEDALPLSEVLARLETTGNVRYFEDIEWDDDGYWEIDYVAVGGEDVEIEVDPVTGAVR